MSSYPNHLWEVMHSAYEREMADNPHAEHAEIYGVMIRAVSDWIEAYQRTSYVVVLPDVRDVITILRTEADLAESNP